MNMIACNFINGIDEPDDMNTTQEAIFNLVTSNLGNRILREQRDPYKTA